MPRRGLDRDTVVRATLALVDRDGLEALTMRSLAAELGVEAPSLYKHVSGKDDILEGAIDLVYEQVHIVPGPEPWPERVRIYSAALRQAFLRHPHLAPLIAVRPITSPTSLALVEMALGELVAAGFAPQEALWVLDTLVSYVTGHVLTELGTNPVLSGLDPSAVAAVRQSLPADVYPNVRATLAGGPIDRDAEFTYGLEVLVSGLEARQ